TCKIRDCSADGQCVKDATTGAASCVCDTGFVLQADGKTCTDTCKIRDCNSNGQCVKDATTGAASCVCDTGFVLQADGKTCTAPCYPGCGANKHCDTTTGVGSCVCDTGYEVDWAAPENCVDKCYYYGCAPGQTCMFDEYTGDPYCNGSPQILDYP
ncbi:unnamed protein product, partial [Closterium sp. NIES-53]